MVRFPSWLDGKRSKPKVRLPKIKKCPICGHSSPEVGVDKKGNYCCLICGYVFKNEDS